MLAVAVCAVIVLHRKVLGRERFNVVPVWPTPFHKAMLVYTDVILDPVELPASGGNLPAPVMVPQLQYVQQPQLPATVQAPAPVIQPTVVVVPAPQQPVAWLQPPEVQQEEPVAPTAPQQQTLPQNAQPVYINPNTNLPADPAPAQSLELDPDPEMPGNLAMSLEGDWLNKIELSREKGAILECRNIEVTAPSACQQQLKSFTPSIYSDCVPETKYAYDSLKSKPFVKPDGSMLSADHKQKIAAELAHMWYPGEQGEGKRSWKASAEELDGETKLARYIVNMLTRIWTVCEKTEKYKTDPRWLNTKAHWPHVVMIFDSTGPGYWRNWEFSLNWMDTFAVLGAGVAPTLGWKERRNVVDLAIAHELAHGTSLAHQETFRSAELFYMHILTNDLGVQVNVSCRDCMMVGLCDKAMCPNCAYEYPGGSVCNCPNVQEATPRLWVGYNMQ